MVQELSDESGSLYHAHYFITCVYVLCEDTMANIKHPKQLLKKGMFSSYAQYG